MSSRYFRTFDLAALICFIINDFFCFSNAQKTSDWTNNSRAIRDLKSQHFKIIMLIFFLLKMLRFFFINNQCHNISTCRFMSSRYFRTFDLAALVCFIINDFFCFSNFRFSFLFLK
jgi:hypothetical protein